jgi:hypothetical protein
MRENARIVTFDSYYDPMLAHVICARLKANGVPCYIADEHMLWAKPYFNEALGGVKLRVFENDFKKCREILAEEMDLRENDAKTDSEINIDNITCDYCGSNNVRYGLATEIRFHWPSLLVSLFAGFPCYFRSAWHCFNCYRDFD